MAQWLSLPGTASHNATTPDTAALDIAGDLDLRVDVAMSDWTPAANSQILNKYQSAGQGGYGLRVNTAGTLSFFWGDTSVLQFKTSTAATGLTDGTRHVIRVTLDVDNGAAGNDVIFYVDGVQLGTTVTSAGTTVIGNSGLDLAVGTNPTGGDPAAGKFYSAQVLDGIAGTVVADFDAHDFTVGDGATDTAVDSTGLTWTINGAGSLIDTSASQAPSPVRSRAISGGVAGTAQTFDFPPTVVAGDTLVAIIAVDTAPTLSGMTGGWTVLDDRVNGDTARLMWKVADGTEGGTTFDLTLSLSRQAFCIVYAIPGGATPTFTAATGTSTTPDHPAHSPGAGEYLWLAMGIYDSNTTRKIRDWPEGFGGWTRPGSSEATAAFSSERLLTGAALDPGTDLLTASTPWIAYTVSIPVTVSPGNYPVVEGQAETNATAASTSQAMNLPAGIVAGELLVADIATNVGNTVAISGWTALAGPVNTGFETGAVLYKVADGTEGATVTVTIGASATMAAVCRRISGADVANSEGTATANATSTVITPPALTPAGGSDSILWFIGYTYDTVEGALFSPWPFNYATAGASIYKDSGLLSGGSALTAASVTPGSFDLELARRTVTWTYAVYPAATVPAAPGNPAAVADSASQITVTWDDVADETGFRVERSPDGVGSWVDVSGNLAAGTVTYPDTGLTASTQYFYRVIAFNGVGDSSPSTVVNATTDAAPGGGGNRMGGSGAIRKPPRRSRA